METASRMYGWRWQLAQWAERNWWRWYLRNKKPAVYLSRKRSFWSNVLAGLNCSPLPGSLVLDAGCGPAGIFILLDNCQVDAADPLLPTYERLPHFRSDAYPWVRFLDFPIEAFEPQQTYDYIFCMNALNHFSDPQLSLDILVAALRPGGTFCFSVDGHKYGWLNAVFRSFPGDILHPHQYQYVHYREMLVRRGLKIEKEVCWKKGLIFDHHILKAIKIDANGA
ncbi:MAG: class I SAM-dependent methyltransferase [Saprospiraceae bacterium]|nr:class I SAM-dependent methyltransferase [Saprospiraceae bacterium]